MNTLTPLERAAIDVAEQLRATGDVHDESLTRLEELLVETAGGRAGYDEMDGKERAVIREAENLCGRCFCSAMCVVSQLQPAALEVVVSRCTGFIDATVPRADGDTRKD